MWLNLSQEHSVYPVYNQICGGCESYVANNISIPWGENYFQTWDDNISDKLFRTINSCKKQLCEQNESNSERIIAYKMLYIPEFCLMDKLTGIISKDRNANMVARGGDQTLVRCCIVGDALVGKTQAVKAFTGAEYREYTPTIFENYAGRSRYIIIIIIIIVVVVFLVCLFFFCCLFVFCLLVFCFCFLFFVVVFFVFFLFIFFFFFFFFLFFFFFFIYFLFFFYYYLFIYFILFFLLLLLLL